MKKTIVGGVVLMLLAAAVCGVGKDLIDRDNLSIKAGPSQPGEELSMAWMEFFVYPKTVKDSPMVSLGARLTAKADKVSVFFEFNGGSTSQIELASRDGLSWNGVFSLPADVLPGLQVARFNVVSGGKSLRRTIDFYVDSSFKAAVADNVSVGRAADNNPWPLTVLSDTVGYTGNLIRELKKGQTINGVAKVLWYKIIFADGQEGWVMASKLLEPTEDYLNLGHAFFIKKDFANAALNYEQALKIDPQYAQAYYWLARAQYNLGQDDRAQADIKKALELDGRDMKVRVFAANLAKQYAEKADAKMNAGRFNEALVAYQKALELNLQSADTYIKLGKCYVSLGLQEEAIASWRQALSLDHENKELRALLVDDLDRAPVPAKIVGENPAVVEKALPAFIAAAKPEIAHPALSDDAINIVKAFVTNKGTRVDAAVQSVVSMTRSLGTPVTEKGWTLSSKDGKFLVSFIVDQRGVSEAFNWLVDVDTRRVVAQNDNARLLMRRW